MKNTSPKLLQEQVAELHYTDIDKLIIRKGWYLYQEDDYIKKIIYK